MSYYNTVGLTGSQLKVKKTREVAQRHRILRFFEENQGKIFTPFEVLEAVYPGGRVPIGSVRRAMTDLTDDGLLAKLVVKKKGDYDHDNHTWTFVRSSKQAELF